MTSALEGETSTDGTFDKTRGYLDIMKTDFKIISCAPQYQDIFRGEGRAFLDFDSKETLVSKIYFSMSPVRTSLG